MIGVAGVCFLVFFGCLIPYGAWRSVRQLAKGPLPPKKPYLISVLIQQVVFTGIALGVAALSDLELFGPYQPNSRDVAIGIAFLLASLVAMAPRWIAKVREHDRLVYLFAPRTGTERVLWIGIAVAAGIGEEIVYRGVFVGLLAPAVGMVAAISIAAIAFTLGHLVQGWRAAPLILAFTAGFHLVVLATGTLYVAMAVHAVYDIIAGLGYGRLADKYRYPRDPLPPPAAPTPEPAA